MTQSKRFCTGCGAPMAADDSFCGSCGKKAAASTAPLPAPDGVAPPTAHPAAPVNPVATASPATAPTASPDAEVLVGMIPSVSRKKGLMAVEGFNIMVTRRRMIFAAITNELIKDEAKKASKQGGFFGGLLNAATAGSDLYKRYLTMKPDAALTENPQNFAVELSRIKKARIQAGKEISDYHTAKANRNRMVTMPQYERGKLAIETVSGTYEFDVPNSSLEMTVATLRKAGLA